MFTGAGGLSVTLRVHIDGRDVDYSLDHDSGVVPYRNSWDRPLYQLFHGECAHVRRVTELSKFASFSRRYATLDTPMIIEIVVYLYFRFKKFYQ